MSNPKTLDEFGVEEVEKIKSLSVVLDVFKEQNKELSACYDSMRTRAALIIGFSSFSATQVPMLSMEIFRWLDAFIFAIAIGLAAIAYWPKDWLPGPDGKWFYDNRGTHEADVTKFTIVSAYYHNIIPRNQETCRQTTGLVQAALVFLSAGVIMALILHR